MPEVIPLAVFIILLIVVVLYLWYICANSWKTDERVSVHFLKEEKNDISVFYDASNPMVIFLHKHDSQERRRTQKNDHPLPAPKELVPHNQDQPWYILQFCDTAHTKIKTPHQLNVCPPPSDPTNPPLFNPIAGSMLGMAIGDALGAHVEFRPYHYLLDHPVTDLSSGGTWGLEKGQFTDDTSMALCLANSLIACQGFNPYDQLVRYKWWYRHGYMSSTGECFDIGAATRKSIEEFERRQTEFAVKYNLSLKQIDSIDDPELLHKFNVNCSEDGVAGNGALMRLAPVPLFFFRHPPTAVDYAGRSAELTHGDEKAIDACRYYAALIVAALHGARKDQLLADNFYETHRDWFDNKELHTDILAVAHGSYKKPGGYDEGIRGGGYVVKALEAALWAFWSDGDSFERGALRAVNLGDDTDTTAAIYGQLAGAYYGLDGLPDRWLQHVYAREFLLTVSKWLAYEGQFHRSNKWQTSSDV